MMGTTQLTVNSIYIFNPLEYRQVQARPDGRNEAAMAADRFAGRVAPVTGGASGIGTATARRFAHEAVPVIAAGADTDGSEQVARQVAGDAGMAHLAPLDVASLDVASSSGGWLSSTRRTSGSTSSHRTRYSAAGGTRVEHREGTRRAKGACGDTATAAAG